MRQDDNGNVFVVKVFDDARAAERERAALDAGGHKQIYWVEAVPDSQTR